MNSGQGKHLQSRINLAHTPIIDLYSRVLTTPFIYRR